MDVRGVNNLQEVRGITDRRDARVGSDPVGTGESAGDSAEISSTARLLERFAQIPEVRQEKVERARAEIEAGTFDTPEKLEIAFDLMFQDIIGDSG